MSIAFIGAGNFAQSYLLPPLEKLDVQLAGVATSSSLSGKSTARKFGFNFCTTDPGKILEDQEITAVFIATRHDSHAKYVVDALLAGKAVFVEKPLCINERQYEEIVQAYTGEKGVNGNPPFLMVGYNRRFSEPIKLIHDLFRERSEPLMLTYRVNAGPLHRKHWLLDPAQGGRIIGEAGHFIDVMQFITGSQPTSVMAECFAGKTKDIINRDNMSITVKFEDGSVGVLTYISTGPSAFPKEYLEVFGAGQVAVMDNFRRVTVMNGSRNRSYKFKGDKGHFNEMKAVVEALREGQESPVSFESLCRTSWVTLAAVSSVEAVWPHCQGEASLLRIEK